MSDESMGMGGIGFWGFLVFAMLLSGGGLFGGGGNVNSNAIQADVNRGFDNQNLQAQTRDILGAVTAGTAQSVAATNQTFHDTLMALQDKYNEIARDINGVQVAQAQALANQNQCCCETKMAIAQNRYDASLNTAATNANITAVGQKILDKLNENEVKAMQNRINQLELTQALTGVVRYPSGMTYNAGASPFCPCAAGYPVV